MTINDLTKVGKKGEILPKKALREYSGIKPGDQVIVEAFPGGLTVRKVYSVKQALNMPIISRDTAEEAKEDIRRELKIQERLTNEEH